MSFSLISQFVFRLSTYCQRLRERSAVIVLTFLTFFRTSCLSKHTRLLQKKLTLHLLNVSRITINFFSLSVRLALEKFSAFGSFVRSLTPPSFHITGTSTLMHFD